MNIDYYGHTVACRQGRQTRPNSGGLQKQPRLMQLYLGQFLKSCTFYHIYVKRLKRVYFYAKRIKIPTFRFLRNKKVHILAFPRKAIKKWAFSRIFTPKRSLLFRISTLSD